MNALHALLDQGQSIWYDFISRDFIASGAMQRLVDLGLRGMTSNPTIFEKAIAGGHDYDEQIQTLGREGCSTADIAAALFTADVTAACDVMRPVYEASGGADGFISLEVNPKLATATDETVAEARAIHRAVDRPNLMVKIPATPEGLPAVRTAIAEGININITLIFSIEQYRNVAESYVAGLEQRLAAGLPINAVNSVASVFVSRIDTMVDAMLTNISTEAALALRGRLAIANARLIYREFQSIFGSERFARLAAHGARPQRPLWASTSTKNPSYPDLIYVDNLIGPDTVNTVPPETLDAILDHAVVHQTIMQDAHEAEATVRAVADAGIDVDAVMAQLLEEGVSKFVASFDALFEKLETRRAALTAEPA